VPINDQWKNYVSDADDFLITYAVTCPCGLLHSHLFLIGHAVELYLKAIYIKQTGDEYKAIKEGHNLKNLFELCQNNTPPFLPKFESNGNYEIFKFKGTYEELYELAQKTIQGTGLTSWEKEKFLHFSYYMEFYLIAENLNNLKYFSCQWKSRDPFWQKHLKYIASYKPNDFWIEFVKQARSYLGYSGEDNDMIKLCLEGFGCSADALPCTSREYLSQIFK
jgi:hypothetical protein